MPERERPGRALACGHCGNPDPCFPV